MDFIPRVTDVAKFPGYQLTVESREFVVRWTGGIFHNDPDPRKWALLLHVGNGLAKEAHLGDWIIKRAGYFEILTCEELDRRYEPLDRPGNPHDRPANQPRPKPATVFADCGCSVMTGWRCPVHDGP